MDCSTAECLRTVYDEFGQMDTDGVKALAASILDGSGGLEVAESKQTLKKYSGERRMKFYLAGALFVEPKL